MLFRSDEFNLLKNGTSSTVVSTVFLLGKVFSFSLLPSPNGLLILIILFLNPHHLRSMYDSARGEILTSLSPWGFEI